MVNVEKQLYTNSSGCTISMRDLAKVFNDDFSDELLRITGIMKRLQLDWEEIALLKAVCLFFTGKIIIKF